MKLEKAGEAGRFDWFAVVAAAPFRLPFSDSSSVHRRKKSAASTG
jgi:hypothetical protein